MHPVASRVAEEDARGVEQVGINPLLSVPLAFSLSLDDDKNNTVLKVRFRVTQRTSCKKIQKEYIGRYP